MGRDPIAQFRAELIAHGVLDEAGADAIAEAAVAEVEAGIEFAKAGTAPSVKDLTRNVYAEA